MKGRRGLGVVLLIAGFVLMSTAASAGRHQPGVVRWLEDAPITVSPGTRRVTLSVPGPTGTITRDLPLQYETDRRTGAQIALVRVPVTGPITLYRLDGTIENFLAVQKTMPLLAVLGVFCWFVGLPYTFLRTQDLKDELGNPVGAWYFLLSERGGGLSLSRVQLLIWFLPAIAIYAGLSIPLHKFAPMDTTLAVLLGLSGATTLLGTVASPASPAAPQGQKAPSVPTGPFYGAQTATGTTPPDETIAKFDPSDLVTDWRGDGDMSRYQYLLLTLVGATVFSIAFLGSMRIPTIPDQFLYLIGASQATYLGTKAVKATKDGSPTPAKS
jgi:hypothetical protein